MFLGAVACAVLLALGGCEGRLRANLLDPDNPVTGGGPVGFRARGGSGGIRLGWNPAPARADLRGFLLERRRFGPGAYLPLGPVHALASTGTLDASALTDLDYEYRLSFLARDSTVSGTPVVAIARAGPEVVWVSEPGFDQVVRLSPDGRERVLSISGVRGVNRLAVDRSDGVVWATEPFDGRMRVFTTLGGPLATFPGLTGPNAVAVDPTSRTAWICDEVSGRVVRYDRGGLLNADAGQFDNPQDVAALPSGGAWIVDAALGTVTRVDATGIRGTTIALGGDPRRLVVDALDGSIWVTRFAASEVVHMSSTGAILSRTAVAQGPFAIDLDESRNRVWVGLDGSDAVAALDRVTGGELFRVGGIARPRGVAVADRTGEVFVAAIAAGQVVRLSSDGAVLGRTGGFDAPFDVRIDPGPRVEP